MSDLEAMCQSFSEVCTLAKGFAIHLDGLANRIETTRNEARQVAGASATFADQLSDAVMACTEASRALRYSAQQGTEYIARINGNKG